jgi:CDP-diacylglycerol---serine O-phosphatidyltransferase
MNIVKSIPSVLTSINLLSGFLAIILNDPLYSPMLIIAGGLFDLMDGAVARKLNASSAFGAELDSLADLISFGAAPAFLYFNHVLINSDKIIAAISVSFIVVFAAIRLAKFNISNDQKYHFIGLPSPASGLFFTFMILESHTKSFFDYNNNEVIWLALPVLFGLLMVSPIKFFAMKKSENKYFKIMSVLTISVFLICCVIWLTTGLPVIPGAFILYILFSIIFYNILIKEKSQ